MPIKMLYCEGRDDDKDDAKKSLDVKVISPIVEPYCFTKSIGSKHGFYQRILGARDAQKNVIIAGIKDRDFDEEVEKPTNEPHQWYAFDEKNNKVQIGWYWDRKEIENYLIDPEVVQRALGSKAPPMTDYKAALQSEASKIANYTAARIALSCVSYPTLPVNYWGEERELGYFFPKDKGLKEADCSG